MNARRPVSLYVVLLVLTFSLLAGLASTVPTCAEPKAASSSGHEKWAVILSPGQQPGVPWGGYHVTIAGYSESNGGNEKAKSLRFAFKTLFHKKPWHLHGALPALEKWKGIWTQTFNSRMLDDLANMLGAEGFDGIKGPIYALTAWHVSLLGDRRASMSEIESFKRGKTEWYLWQVPEPPKTCKDNGTDCPSWKLIN